MRALRVLPVALVLTAGACGQNGTNNGADGGVDAGVAADAGDAGVAADACDAAVPADAGDAGVPAACVAALTDDHGLGKI